MSSRRGGRRVDTPEVRLSKFLSYLLRHGAEKEGISLRSDGFAVLDDIMALPRMKNYKFEDVKKIVDTNDKKRFVLQEENGKMLIKATQGHTVEVKELSLQPITDAKQHPIVVHGTTKKNWPLIKKSGLNRMKRNHIHFAQGEYGSAQVISGMRQTSQVMIYIDLDKAMKDGVQFFLSENGVILSEGIDGVLEPKYFSHVISTTDNAPFDSDFPNPRNSSKQNECTLQTYMMACCDRFVQLFEFNSILGERLCNQLICFLFI